MPDTQQREPSHLPFQEIIENGRISLVSLDALTLIYERVCTVHDEFEGALIREMVDQLRGGNSRCPSEAFRDNYVDSLLAVSTVRMVLTARIIHETKDRCLVAGNVTYRVGKESTKLSRVEALPRGDR